MADSAWVPARVSAMADDSPAPRHRAFVRVTHWLTAACFFALLVSGFEIVISHPRFYWGETGNDLTPPLFQIPIPASRALVPTGYGYVLPDQNGWSRALHFQTAWALMFTGLFYLIAGLLTNHFAKNLLPAKADLALPALAAAISGHLRIARSSVAERSYNVVQRLTYLVVIFVLFPLTIWSGLAMSPAFTSAFHSAVTLLGGRQAARTIHFFLSLALLLFVVVHLAMISIAGFRSRMRAMITGRTSADSEHT